MSAVAKLKIVEDVAALPALDLVKAPAEVLIHVRFQPNAEIFTIDGLPQGVSQKAWFETLYMTFPQYYRALANGRGFFRLPREAFEALAA